MLLQRPHTLNSPVREIGVHHLLYSSSGTKLQLPNAIVLVYYFFRTSAMLVVALSGASTSSSAVTAEAYQGL